MKKTVSKFAFQMQPAALRRGLSRFSSIMNSVYRKYLGDEPYDFYPEVGGCTS
jgi:hypothetical protein